MDSCFCGCCGCRSSPKKRTPGCNESLVTRDPEKQHMQRKRRRRRSVAAAVVVLSFAFDCLLFSVSRFTRRSKHLLLVLLLTRTPCLQRVVSVYTDFSSFSRAFMLSDHDDGNLSPGHWLLTHMFSSDMQSLPRTRDSRVAVHGLMSDVCARFPPTCSHA